MNSPAPVKSAVAVMDEDKGIPPRGKWPKLLADMVDVVEVALKREKIPDDSVEKLARATVAALSTYFGGRVMYIPTGVRLRLALRDASIYRALGHEALDDIAKKHGITVNRAYQICAEQRELRRSKL